MESRYSKRTKIISSSKPSYVERLEIGFKSLSASSIVLWKVTTKSSGLLFGSRTTASFWKRLNNPGEVTGSQTNKSLGRSWTNSGKTLIQISSEYSQPKLSIIVYV